MEGEEREEEGQKASWQRPERIEGRDQSGMKKTTVD